MAAADGAPEPEPPPAAPPPAAAAEPYPATVALGGGGAGGVRVPPVGVGTLALTVLYPDPARRPAWAAAVAALRGAADRGVRFFDTADTYRGACGASAGARAEDGYGERMVAAALAGHPARARCVVCTKGGMARTGDGATSSSWAPRARFGAAS